MSNLKATLMSIVLAGVCGCAHSIESKSVPECLERVYGAALVRVDPPNHRAFLVWSPTPNLAQLRALANRGLVCFNETEWSQRYSLSVFSAGQFAGYMTESHIRPYLSDGTWEESYAVEIDGASGQITLSPAKNPRSFPLSP